MPSSQTILAVDSNELDFVWAHMRYNFKAIWVSIDGNSVY